MASYDNPWTFDSKEFTEEDIGDSYGFVYLITNITTGRKYIGRKYFWSVRKKKKTDKRRTKSQSDWKAYYGSSPELTEEIEKYGKDNFRREILSLHSTKGRVNFEEVREQFKRDVLEKDGYINANINGKWHRSPDHISEKSRYASGSSGRPSE